MFEALKRLKLNVQSDLNREEAITDEIFDNWDSKKQSQWIKDHPTSKYASKDYKKKSNKSDKKLSSEDKKLNNIKGKIKELTELKKKYKRQSNIDKIDAQIKKLKDKAKQINTNIKDNARKEELKDAKKKFIDNDFYSYVEDNISEGLRFKSAEIGIKGDEININWMSQDYSYPEDYEQIIKALKNFSNRYLKDNKSKITLTWSARDGWDGPIAPKTYLVRNGGVQNEKTTNDDNMEDTPAIKKMGKKKKSRTIYEDEYTRGIRPRGKRPGKKRHHW